MKILGLRNEKDYKHGKMLMGKLKGVKASLNMDVLCTKHTVDCRYCANDFSIASSGAYDIERHCKMSETYSK
jgi:hypothetical protein